MISKAVTAVALATALGAAVYGAVMSNEVGLLRAELDKMNDGVGSLQKQFAALEERTRLGIYPADR